MQVSFGTTGINNKYRNVNFMGKPVLTEAQWVERIVANTSEINNGFHSAVGFKEIKKQTALNILDSVIARLGPGYKKALEAKKVWVEKYLTD